MGVTTESEPDRDECEAACEGLAREVQKADPTSESKKRYQALVREASRIQGRAEAVEREIVDLASEIEAVVGARGRDAAVDAARRELEAHAAGLAELTGRMAEVEAEILEALQRCPALAASSAAKTSVGFVEEAEHHTYSYREDPLNAVVSPAHGHWLRDAAAAAAAGSGSEQEAARMLGGALREVQVRSPGIDVVDCIVVEPMGKTLDPDNFAGGGMVLIIHGQPACEELATEWAEVLRMTRLLDAGITVVMPLLLAPDPSVEVGDLRALLRAVMQELGQRSVVVWGKAWGGAWAAQIAAMAAAEPPPGLGVAGLVVFAPTAVDRDVAIQAMQLPTLLAWAVNDEESDFEENSPAWVDGLRSAPPPTLWAVVEDGGDNVPAVMAQPAAGFWGMQVGPATGYFVVCCLVLAAMELHSEAADDLLEVPPEIRRLCEELPDHLSGQLDGEPGVHFALAVEDMAHTSGVQAALERLQRVVREWLRANFAERPPRRDAGRPFVPSGGAKE